MKYFVILIVIVAALFGISYVLPKQNTPSNTTVTPTVQEESSQDEKESEAEKDEESSEVKEFTIVGKPFSFTPNKIEVDKGDTVRIIFKNEQGVHDWKIDEFNAGTKQLQAGQNETIEFVADKTGSFEFYCSVGNHRQIGMVGTLIVE